MFDSILDTAQLASKRVVVHLNTRAESMAYNLDITETITYSRTHLNSPEPPDTFSLPQSCSRLPKTEECSRLKQQLVSKDGTIQK